MRTSRSNMRRLRAGLIGSISAWLPSRRSTAHHRGAFSITRSGQVRSGTRMGSTSSANGRYRLTGIEEPRCGFHAGWPGAGGPAGLTIFCADVNASGLVVTVITPRGCGGPQTGASRTPATGSRSGSDPVAASEEEHPLHVVHSTLIYPLDKIRGILVKPQAAAAASTTKIDMRRHVFCCGLNRLHTKRCSEGREEKRGARRT